MGQESEAATIKTPTIAVSAQARYLSAYPEQADSGTAAHQQPGPSRLLAGPDRRRRRRRRRDRRPRVPSSGAGDGRATGPRRGHQLGC